MSDNGMLQSTNPSPLANASFSEVLDELATRFIINVPDEEFSSLPRICFQIEQAHWFYEDFVREQQPQLPSFTLKNFCIKIFRHCPLLRQWSNETEKAFAAFLEYKTRVPVCGAVILNANTDKVLLVKGWTSKSGWGFPKGKINKDELDAACAVREVLEETGYDIAGLIKEEDYIELTIREQRMRLYIVVGVPEDASFAPITRKEISRVEWHHLSDLPTWGRNKPSQNKQGTRQYYMVVPFVSKIRSWLARMKKVVEDPGLAEEQTETSEVSDNDIPKYTYRRAVATSSSVNGRHITAPRPVAATASAAIAALASSNSTSAYSEQQRRSSLLSLFQQDTRHRSPPPPPNTTQWQSENPVVSYSSSDRSTSLLSLLEGGISSSSTQRTRQDSGTSHSLTDGGSLSSLYQDLLTSTGLTTDAKLSFLNNRSVNGHQIQSDTSSINTGSTDFSLDGYNPGTTSDNSSSVSSSSDSSSSIFPEVYPLQEGYRYGLIDARGNDTFAVTGVGMKVGESQSPWLNFRFDTSKILAAMNRASNSVK